MKHKKSKPLIKMWFCSYPAVFLFLRWIITEPYLWMEESCKVLKNDIIVKCEHLKMLNFICGSMMVVHSCMTWQTSYVSSSYPGHIPLNWPRTRTDLTNLCFWVRTWPYHVINIITLANIRKTINCCCC